MPLSPTGSSKSFKGPMDLDRSDRERRTAAGASSSSTSTTTPTTTTTTPSPSSATRDLATEELFAITRNAHTPLAAPELHHHHHHHHPTPWELYEKPTSPSPTSPSHSKFRVTLTSGPHDNNGTTSTAPATTSPLLHSRMPLASSSVDGAMDNSSALRLASVPGPSGPSNASGPSPVSPGSAGSNNGHPSLHGPASATTPPSAMRSPGSAGGFFAAFRPASPRIITTPAKEEQSHLADRRKEKERTASSSALDRTGLDQQSPRMPREKGLDSRSRRPSSVFDHVGSVFERFSKKVHSRGESRESIRANLLSSSSALAPATEESDPAPSPQMEYLASPSRHPGLQRNYSASSAISARSTDDFTVLSRRPVLERTLIQVTEDNERFAVVDVSGLNSAAGIKERMLSKLHRFEEDSESFSVFRTEIGLTTDPAESELGDDGLMAVCLQSGDDKGTLKFLLKQTAPAAHPSRVGPPPSSATSRTLHDTPVSPRAQALVSSPSESASAFSDPAAAAAAAAATHSKSESLSSLSSISDALAQADNAISYDSGSETARRNGLSRSKAVERGARRSRGSNSAEENRISLASSTTPSRPTSALLSVHEQSSSSNTATADNEGTWQSGETIRVSSAEDVGSSATTTTTAAGAAASDAGASSSSLLRSVTPLPDSDRDIEELQNEDPHNLPPSNFGSKFRRRPSSQRPATSSGALEPATSEAAGHAEDGVMRQRTSSVSSIPENHDTAHGRAHDGSAANRDLPKSLQPAGGEQPRSYDANDAARMYNQPFDDRHVRVTSDELLNRVGSVDKATRLAPMRSMDELGGWHRREAHAAEGQQAPAAAAAARPQLVDPFTQQIDSRSDGRYPTMATVRGGAKSPAPQSNEPPPAYLKPRQGSFDTAQQSRPILAGTARPPALQPHAGYEQIRNAGSSTKTAVREPMQRPQTAQAAPVSFGRPPVNFPLPSPAPPAFRPAVMRMASSSEGHYHSPALGPVANAPVDPYGYARPPGARPAPYAAAEFGMPIYPAQRGQPHSAGMPPFSSQSLRPHTYHDTPNLYYRPPPPRPIEPPENPYTRAMFPASSSRQVSDFQRFGHAVLSPGMTVQDTLRQQQQQQQQHQRGNGPASHPQAGQAQHFGPREPRSSHGAVGHMQAGQGYHQPALHHAQQHQPYPGRDQRMPLQQHPSHHHHQQHPHAASYSPRTHDARPYPPQQSQSAQHQSPQAQSGHSQGPYGQHPQTSRPPVLQQQRSFKSSSPPRATPLQLVPGHDVSGQQAGSRPKPPQQQPNSAAQHSVPRARPPREGQDWSSGASASDRSSGSSYVSSGSDSHRRDHSLEEVSYRNSVEGTHTAPTSARSSRSAPLSPDTSRRPEGSTTADSRRRGAPGADTDDIDLSKIRPLPQLPPMSPSSGHGSTASTPLATSELPYSQPTEDEGTLKAAELATLLASAGQGTSSHAAQSLARPATTTSATSPSDAPSASTVKGSGAVDTTHTLPVLHADDAEGTFAAFGSFDDDDDDDNEGGTWAKPLDAAPAKSAGKDATGDANDDDGSGTVRALPSLQPTPGLSAARVASPRRPELRLTIDPSAGPTTAAASADLRLALPSPRAGAGSGGEESALSQHRGRLSPALQRRSSFARSAGDDWVLRPPPEQLYENLDEFFPKHDLDKPVMEAGGAPNSPMTGSAVTVEKAQASPSTATPVSPSSASSLARHKKSIRRIAEDRRRYMERNEPGAMMRQSGGLGVGLTSLTPANASSAAAAAVGNDGNLGRKRSTKLWGTRLLEMTPGQDQQGGAGSAATSASPVTDASGSSSRPVFKWVKGDLIGKGTYGRVYIALNATTGEMIAVKQVERPRTDSDREDSRQKGVVAALKSEIDTLKDLDHPNIVSYLGFEETPKFLHLFLEYVPGGSIASVLRKYGKLEEATIKFFVNQVLSGLSYLHERGVLHRDLKGDNLLVSLDGTVKISDFGTVRRSDDIYNNVEGMSLQGSVFWMAPEVVSLSKKGYSAKVDIWSLGCVVLEMFAGRRPWSDDEAIQAMFKIGKEGRAPPVPPDVRLSQEATHFLKCCFQLDPSCRPTASRLLEHVFPFVGNDWNFESSRLYRTMRRSLQNRNGTTATGAGAGAA